MSEATPAGIQKVHVTDALGATIAGGVGSAVSIADGSDVAEGTMADAAWVSGPGTVIAILKKIASSGASAGLTDTQLRATPVPVSGAFFQATQPISAAALPLPAGASTEATLLAQTVSTNTLVAALKHQPVGAQANASAQSFTEGSFAPLSQTLAGALRISGTVTATGPLTDTQLRASAVPVSGAFFQATQPVSLASTTITGSVAVTGPLTDTQLRASAVPVSGTFFQGTQPVSLAAAVDVSDRAARLLGVVDKGKIWDGTNIAAVSAALALKVDGSAVTQPVSGAFFQATQPVSIAASVAVTGTFFQATQPISAVSLPLPTGAATETTLAAFAVATGTAIGALKHQPVGAQANASAPSWTEATFAPFSQTLAGALRIGGTVTAAQGAAGTAAAAWFAKVTDGTSTQAVKAASTLVAAADPAAVVSQHPSRGDASTLAVTATGVSAAAVTLTLPAAAAGLFHYITSIQIVAFATVLRTAAATPVLVTTTNLPGTPAFSFKANAMTLGDSEVQSVTPTTPLKSSVAATATTIVCPATTAVLWRVNVTYYTAP